MPYNVGRYRQKESPPKQDQRRVSPGGKIAEPALSLFCLRKATSWFLRHCLFNVATRTRVTKAVSGCTATREGGFDDRQIWISRYCRTLGCRYRCVCHPDRQCVGVSLGSATRPACVFHARRVDRRPCPLSGHRNACRSLLQPWQLTG